MKSRNIPVVMTIAGNDPTGGAGLQADIETLASLGCHAAPVVTAITCQDTSDVRDFMSISADYIAAQARTVLADMNISVFKIGMLADGNTVRAVAAVLKEHSHIPVVLDPVLHSGAGTSLKQDDLVDAIISELLPITTIITPNTHEAQLLTGATDPEHCAHILLTQGCDYVLVTGTHDQSADVINRLYQNNADPSVVRHFERLPGEYHGSGCTLASAIAAGMANGLDITTAVEQAQTYTIETLRHAYQPGQGQQLPDRFFSFHDKKPTK